MKLRNEKEKSMPDFCFVFCAYLSFCKKDISFVSRSSVATCEPARSIRNASGKSVEGTWKWTPREHNQ